MSKKNSHISSSSPAPPAEDGAGAKVQAEVDKSVGGRGDGGKAGRGGAGPRPWTRPEVPEVVWPSAARSDSEAAARATYEALHRAFHWGDYATVREGTARLAAEGGDEEVHLRAKALRARLRLDPLAIGVAVGAAVLWILTLISAMGLS